MEVRSVWKRRYAKLIVIAVDVVLIGLPVALNRLAGIEVALMIPGVVALVISLHLWSSQRHLLASLDERVELAKLRSIPRHEESELYEFVDLLTRDLVRKLERLKHGELLLATNEEYWRFVNRALREAETDVKAIDVNTDPELLLNWRQTGPLQEYYRCCLEVVRREHTFERVFVFKRDAVLSDDGRLDPSIASVLQQQSKDGIDVYVVWTEDLYGIEPKLPISRDYLLFSNDKVVHAEAQLEQPYYTNAVVTKALDVLQQYTLLHEAIKRRSRTLNEFPEQVPLSSE